MLRTIIFKNKLVRLIGVDNTRINQIINNKRGITVDTDIRLCTLFRITEVPFKSARKNTMKKSKKI